MATGLLNTENAYPGSSSGPASDSATSPTTPLSSSPTNEWSNFTRDVYSLSTVTRVLCTSRTFCMISDSFRRITVSRRPISSTWTWIRPSCLQMSSSAKRYSCSFETHGRWIPSGGSSGGFGGSWGASAWWLASGGAGPCTSGTATGAAGEGRRLGGFASGCCCSRTLAGCPCSVEPGSPAGSICEFVAGQITGVHRSPSRSPTGLSGSETFLPGSLAPTSSFTGTTAAAAFGSTVRFASFLSIRRVRTAYGDETETHVRSCRLVRVIV